MLLLGVCMKYLKDEEEAKDAVQQIFLKVITELAKYKVEYFKSWLYMIAKNQCLMKLRERHGKIPVELSEKLAAEEIQFKTELLEKDKTLSLIEEGLLDLNEEQKQCVTLFYLQKKSYQDITSITGYSLLQVKSYIQNGKRNLKMIVEKKLKNANG
jgi:RNA polymerase sigma-70 factor (ECF subfamily)